MKKVFTLLWSVVTLLAFATAAHAQMDAGVYHVGGVEITAGGETSGNGWTWSNNTLTLSADVSVSAPTQSDVKGYTSGYSAIVLPNSATIDLKTYTLTATSVVGDAVLANHELSIIGNGTLKASGSTSGKKIAGYSTGIPNDDIAAGSGIAVLKGTLNIGNGTDFPVIQASCGNLDESALYAYAFLSIITGDVTITGGKLYLTGQMVMSTFYVNRVSIITSQPNRIGEAIFANNETVGLNTVYYGRTELPFITARVAEEGGGTVTGGGTYDINATVTLSATPADGYDFVNWTVNGKEVSTQSNYTFKATADVEVVANFTDKDKVTWAFADGTLTISGKGAMTNYASGEEAPWYDSFFTDITSIVIEEGVTTIGDGAFIGCESASSVTIAQSVTSIGDRAFGYCLALPSVEIPNSVTSIGESAFNRCDNMETIELGSGLESIGDYAFYACKKLTSIVIPNSVKTIGKTVFSVSGLSSIEIGSGIESIGSAAFFELELTSVTMHSIIPPTIDSDVFMNVDLSKVELIVPEASLEAYKQANVWKEFKFPSAQYTITAVPNSNLYGTVTGSGTYDNGTEITLTANAYGAYKFVNWTTVDGTELSTANPYIFTVAKDILIFANFEFAVGLNDGDASSVVSIYPNPATDIFYISSPTDVVNIEIVHTGTGRVAKVLDHNIANGISVAHLPAGSYLVRIANSEGSSVHKLIKR